MSADVAIWLHEGLRGLEVWDVLVDGRSLFARRAELTFADAVAAFTLALRRGDAVREAGERLPVVPWDDIAIVGGGVDVAATRAAFAKAGLARDVAFVSDDPFYVATGASFLLDEVVVIDVGQTAIKAVGPRARIHQPRGDSNELAGLAGDVARAIGRACDGVVPSLVLLALPCEVEACGERLELGASTYPTGPDGHAFVREILDRCAMPAVPVRLVNDAVLAAQVATPASRADGRTRLVLTIGHGVGAAVAGGG